MPEEALAAGGRPTLAAWLAEYAAIEDEFVREHEARGVTFAAREVRAACNALLRAGLRRRGARFMNGGSSISAGFLSSACAACVGDCGSRTFFVNLRCNRKCYFCFNPNQADYEERRVRDAPWREELEAFAGGGRAVSHIGLTGGEPLLCRDEALAFLRRARELAPSCHLRLYTSGAGLDEAFCEEAVAYGLDEIRFSIKLDEGEASVRESLDGIRLARRFIPDVMVEMPVAPDELSRMKRLLRQLDECGVRGINLLELCYPFHNWSEFQRRGYRVKNPAFEVLYDYGYAGGLPIDGSEEACLALLEFALDEGLRLGVHYCSLDNKNRDQVLQQNRTVRLDPALYELGDDCFYRIAKVFDGDVGIARGYLEAVGAAYDLDEDGRCLAFHPVRLAEVAALGTLPALSWNVIEREDGGALLRELKLALWRGGERPR